MNGKPALLEPTLLAQIYLLKKEGKKSAEIQKQLNTNTNPTEIFNRINYLLQNSKKYAYPNYKKALEMIQKSVTASVLNSAPIKVPIDVSHIEDPFEILQTGYDLFTNTLQTFVESLIKNQIEGEREKYNTLLKEHKQLQQEYQDLKNQSRNSNWVNQLKNKFS